MTDRSIEEGKCFQCGRSDFIFDPSEGEDEWIVCEHCGERFISAKELKQRTDAAEEDRIRQFLGSEEFLKSRGIDKDSGEPH